MCGVPTAVGRETNRAGGEEAREVKSDPRIALAIAGVGVVLLVILLVLLQREPETEIPAPVAQAPAPAAGPVGDPSGVDLSSMTPREAADRLFNRVMQSVSAGDTAQARAFAPMAITSYSMVDGLDIDGRYHLAVIQLVNNQPEDALATANSILAENPVHLFGLFTAAQAHQAMGETEQARESYQMLLDNFDDELAASRSEYTEHSPVLPEMQREARQATGG